MPTQAGSSTRYPVCTHCSPHTQSICSLSQEQTWQHIPLLNSTDTQGGTIVLHVGFCEEYTGHNLDLSQGMLSSDHSSTKQVEHSSLWEHQWQV